MLIEALFYVFGALLIAAALGVITARNPVYSALALVMCFISSAAIWLLIEAEFLAVVLVLVYVGAVMVLFLFVVMMLDVNLAELRQGFTRFAWLGWLTALAVIVEIVGVVWGRGGLGIDAGRGATPTAPTYSNTLELGRVLYTRYAYPLDRKSTRLNSSHSQISYAVFCLKKKETQHVDDHGPSPVAFGHQLVRYTSD